VHEGIKKRIVPTVVVLGLIGLLIYQLVKQGSTECKVCVTFKERRQCATAVAASRAVAAEEAQRSACSLVASGVTEAFACPNVAPDDVTCSLK
jgi:hypothetical protein